MQQLFPRGANTLARASLFAFPLLGCSLVWAAFVYGRFSYGTGQGIDRVQPVPFSHEHHVGVLGIDCRYCHTSVETSSYAGLPPTKICMNCHSQIWLGSNVLEPVRDSYRSEKSLEWQRVYNLPGYVYFDHSIHIHKGVGCTSCHGHIDEMPFTYQEPSLLMEWCLDCHRNPAPNLREPRYVFDVRWAPGDQGKPDRVSGSVLADHDHYNLHDTQYLTSCYTCHR